MSPGPGSNERQGPARTASPSSAPPTSRPIVATGRRVLHAVLLLAVVAVLVVGPLVSGAPRSDATPAVLATPMVLATPPVRSDALSPEAKAEAKNEMNPAKAVVLGVVEGLTEYLPVSSTGHLTVVQRWLDIGTTDATKAAADAYAVVIQAGAILAVGVLYWRRLVSMFYGLLGRDVEGRRILIALVVAFLPAAIIGFLFEKPIKDHLFGVWPVVAAWIVGGVILLALSTSKWWARERRGIALDALTIRDALIIGVAQCLALWPGTSRSLVTLVAGVLIGMSLASAVEFAFLLGLLTLGAATAFDGLKHGSEIVQAYGFASPLIGFVVAFGAALIAVRWMVAYLQNHSLAIFGWYRLGVAALAIVLVMTGVINA